MEKEIIEALETISQRKKENKTTPTFALDVELRDEIDKRVKEHLRQLWRDNKIRVGRTLNHNFIELKSKDSPPNKSTQIVHPIN
ncbi:MAG: hypothetical protein N4A74_07505 [Carboxylicivirga sp.]|jgi:uncharacterized protein YajQ (UPF0234 family)|nr:hypothetical protein [Carboxylicivirga sp.]